MACRQTAVVRLVVGPAAECGPGGGGRAVWPTFRLRASGQPYPDPRARAKRPAPGWPVPPVPPWGLLELGARRHQTLTPLWGPLAPLAALATLAAAPRWSAPRRAPRGAAGPHSTAIQP